MPNQHKHLKQPKHQMEATEFQEKKRCLDTLSTVTNHSSLFMAAVNAYTNIPPGILLKTAKKFLLKKISQYMKKIKL